MPEADRNADTWVVIPVFNEATVVLDVIRGVHEVFANVVCIDDGSSDDSAAEVRSAGAHLVRHPVNLGQGAALQTGIEYALLQPGGRYFVTFDSDGQHSPADAEALVEALRTGGYDVAFGSRFLDKRTELSRLKKAVLKAAVVYTNLTTRMALTDAHNGLRAFNREVAESLHIRSNGMAHASEIVEAIRRGGFRYTELPVHIAYTEYSKAKGQSLFNSVNILFDLIFR